MATQNPIEQEGTYPLPEAQVDRFMLKVVINYPKIEEKKKIIRMNISGESLDMKPIGFGPGPPSRRPRRRDGPAGPPR